MRKRRGKKVLNKKTHSVLLAINLTVISLSRIQSKESQSIFMGGSNHITKAKLMVMLFTN